jgi:hypothetical protein
MTDAPLPSWIKNGHTLGAAIEAALDDFCAKNNITKVQDRTLGVAFGVVLGEKLAGLEMEERTDFVRIFTDALILHASVPLEVQQVEVASAYGLPNITGEV